MTMARYVNMNLAPIYLNETACGQIKFMPTEDVAPVVRCEDYIFSGFADKYENRCCERTGEEIQQNDFCSRGEKKKIERVANNG